MSPYSFKEDCDAQFVPAFKGKQNKEKVKKYGADLCWHNSDKNAN